MKLEEYTRARGSATNDKARGTSYLLMAILTMVSMRMASHKVKVSIHGLMGKPLMVSGLTGKRKATASGKASMLRATSGSGRQTRLMATECTPGTMATSTKESGHSLFDTVKVLISFQMEIFTLVCTSKASQVAKVSTNGQMATLIKVSSRKV